MRSRRCHRTLTYVIALAGLGCLGWVAVGASPAAPAVFDTTTTTTDPSATTTTVPSDATTTTATTTAAPPATTAPVAPSTTAPAAATTAPAVVPPSSRPRRLEASPIAGACRFGTVAILRPNRPPSLLHAGRLAYPADGAIVSATPLATARGGCTISLFGGAAVGRTILRSSGRASLVALTAGGKSIPVHAGDATPVGGWGLIRVEYRAATASAVRVVLGERRDGLPARTIVIVAFGRLSAGQLRREQGHLPLTVAPPLALRHYVFPVVGKTLFGDSYGGFRSDVPGNWHHGDDIFAPLGTPVVAVADGTINRVGWEDLGGWRLWVRDRAGDEFYYAHLSGYAPAALRARVVRAGEVLGFVGDTGDAITTPPHLHFEVHPRQLLHLGYDGAVDPTSYLRGWAVLRHVSVPRPVHPQLPGGPVRQEARRVFRELLAARHLIRAPAPAQPPRLSLVHASSIGTRISPAAAAGVSETKGASSLSPLAVALFCAFGSSLLFAGWLELRSRTREKS